MIDRLLPSLQPRHFHSCGTHLGTFSARFYVVH